MTRALPEAASVWRAERVVTVMGARFPPPVVPPLWVHQPAGAQRSAAKEDGASARRMSPEKSAFKMDEILDIERSILDRFLGPPPFKEGALLGGIYRRNDL